MSSFCTQSNLGLLFGFLLCVAGLTACESNNFYSGQSAINQPTNLADSNQPPQEDSSQLDEKPSSSAQLEKPSPQLDELPTSFKDEPSQSGRLSSTDYAICKDYPTPSICISDRLQLQQEAESQSQKRKKNLKERQEEKLEQQEYERQQAYRKYLDKSNQP